jgi:prolyl 4-hydroxylase
MNEVMNLNPNKKLTPQWREWIKDRLRKGATFQTIVAKMIEQEFDPAYAMTAVQIYHDELRSDYIYETPRFSHAGGYVQTSDRKIAITARLDKPCMVMMDDVLSPEECERLIDLSQNHLSRSKTLNSVSGEKSIDEYRTSHGYQFDWQENEFVVHIQRRLSEVMNMPVEHAERLQIFNYQPGQEFKPHYDFYSPYQPGSQPYLEKRGQRVSTLIVYLNDVEEGGETTFPSIGLSVLPKQGSALYFEYCNSLDQVDRLTLHAGTPIVKGEKWIATQWMRQRKHAGQS